MGSTGAFLQDAHGNKGFHGNMNVSAWPMKFVKRNGFMACENKYIYIFMGLRIFYGP